MSDIRPAVFEATDAVADWEAARATLMRAFALSQEAARETRPIVYVVHGDDLLGRRGAPSAMVATGLLSAARTAAIELSRHSTPVNVLAVDDHTERALIDGWVSHLSQVGGPTGEIVRLGAGHLGKALP